MFRYVRVVLVVALLVGTLALAPLAAQAQGTRLVVYTYDSFLGPAGLITEAFKEKRPDVDIQFVAQGDAGEVLARVIAELEAGGPTADVLIGLSDTQLPRALARNIFEPIDKTLLPNLAHVPEELLFDETGHVVPLDHGYVSLVYNSELLAEDEVPKSLDDLTNPIYRDKIIVIDPRTSSPGHAFLMWTIAKYGDPGYLDFWRRLAPNLLTITGGWSAAYQYFEAGEAAIIVSYTTDTAYSMMYGAGERQQVLTPEGEAYRQIEGVGIVAGTENVALAHEFLDHILSVDVQQHIPTANWMFPVNENTPLPLEWEQYAIVPDNPMYIDPAAIEANEARWLREWADAALR